MFAESSDINFLNQTYWDSFATPEYQFYDHTAIQTACCQALHLSYDWKSYGKYSVTLRQMSPWVQGTESSTLFVLVGTLTKIM